MPAFTHAFDEYLYSDDAEGFRRQLYSCLHILTASAVSIAGKIKMLIVIKQTILKELVL